MKIFARNLSIALLFLFSVNLYNYESRILVVVFLAAMLFIQRGSIPITQTSAFLGIYSLIYYGFAIIYNPDMMTYYIIPFLLGPFMGYSVGIILMRGIDCDKNKLLKIVIYAVILGRFVHGLLNFIASNGYSGYVRNGVDFWTKSTIAATGQGALMTMVISLLFYVLFILKRNDIIEKIVVLSAVIMALVNSLLSASRTALIIMITVFCLCSVMYVLLSNISKTKKTKMIMGIMIVFAILAVFYQNNVFGVKTYWETTPLYERLNTESDYQLGDENRMEMIIDTLNNALDNPLGSGDMSSTAHNMWLDALKQTGWLPFILLVAFTVMVVKKVIRLIRNKSVPTDIKYLAFSVILGSLINFGVEPIMKGMPYYFVAFCVIVGAVDEYGCNTKTWQKGDG